MTSHQNSFKSRKHDEKGSRGRFRPKQTFQETLFTTTAQTLKFGKFTLSFKVQKQKNT